MFLIHLGKEPRGIVASGWTIDEPERNPDWHLHRKKSGPKWYVQLEWDTIRLPEFGAILPLDRLKRSVSSKMNWQSQGSGISIPQPIAEKLESEWAKVSKKVRAIPPIQISVLSDYEGGLSETITYRRGRSRRLRDAAWREGNGVCACCDQDFKKVLNGRGVSVLQVHHIKQIGFKDKPTLTQSDELAVVCANCHRLIHANPKSSLPVGTLRRMLRRASA